MKKVWLTVQSVALAAALLAGCTRAQASQQAEESVPLSSTHSAEAPLSSLSQPSSSHSSETQSSSLSQPSSSKEIKEGEALTYPPYLEKLFQGRKDGTLTPEEALVQGEKISCKVIREDVSIEREMNGLMHKERYGKALQDLDLRRAAAGEEAAWDLKKPFSICFSDGTQTDTFSFSSAGVRYNQVLYIPQNKEVLQDLLQEDAEGDQGFMTREVKTLGTDLPFSAEEVERLVLQRSHYNEEITMTITTQDTIKRLLEECQSRVVTVLSEEDQGDMMTGGSFDQWEYRLKNGDVYTLGTPLGTLELSHNQDPKTLRYSQIFSQTEVLEEVLYSYKKIPALAVSFGEEKGRVDLQSFAYGGDSRESAEAAPMSYYFDAPVQLSEDSRQGKISFSVSPKSFTAEMIPCVDWGEMGEPASLSVGQDGTFSLPEKGGKYFLRVRASYPEGEVEYLSGFLLSDLPFFFESIEYSNESGGVQVTREDKGLTIQGGQNRQYVDFIQALKLSRSGTGAGEVSSKIAFPFTLSFSDGSSVHTFSFKAGSGVVQVDGTDYQMGNPSAAETIYREYDPWEGGKPLDFDTMRMLSAADLQSFGQKYSIQAGDIASASRIQYKMYQRSVSGDDSGKVTYSFTLDKVSEGTGEIPAGELGALVEELNRLPVAKVEEDVDAYDYGTYFAYEIKMKDGTSYTIDRKILINGEESGWYAIPVQRTY